MKIEIGSETSMKDVQEKFTEVYPYLKVDFYRRQHAEQELSAKKDMISSDKLFSQVGKSLIPKSIDISRHRTVAELENAIYEKFDIAMQVSRKSGDIWIQTSTTDHRTLEMQNQSGKAMSSRSIGSEAEEAEGRS